MKDQVIDEELKQELSVKCRRCDLYKTCVTPCIGGVGPLNASLFFCAEAPGAEEDNVGTPLVGEADKIFDALLKDSNISRKEVYITNTVQCRPPKNRNPKPKELKACFPYLLESLEKVRPDVIIPMGKIALQALTTLSSISKLQGEVFFHPQFNAFVIPVLHPAALYRDLMEEDYSRYVETIKIFKNIKQFTNKKLRRVRRSRVLVDNIELGRKVFDKVKNVQAFGFDSETSGFDYLADEVLGISLSFFEGAFYDFFIPNKFIDYVYLEKVMQERNNILIGHNIKFDAHFMRKNNVDILKKGFFDTMLAHYLLDEDAKGCYDLKTRSWIHTDFGGYEEELKKHLPKKNISFKDVPISILSKYACLDAEAVLRIYFKLRTQLIDNKLVRPFSLLLDATRLLVDIERNGILVDMQYLLNLEKEGFSFLESKEEELRNITEDKNFNIRSVLQIQNIFKKLGIISPKKTPKGAPSTDREALLKLRGSHIFVDTLIEYRENFTLYNTHARKIKEQIKQDGRIHPSYLLHGTATGRLSCVGPNWQQVPKLKKFRNMYVPSAGNKIIEGDFSQMELRVLAHYSEDATLIDAFMKGEDIHERVAMETFGVSKEEAKAYRSIAKGISFGIIYGRGSWSIAEELKISIDEAKSYIKRYFDRFPKVYQFVNGMRDIARKEGEVLSLFGRKRRLSSSFASNNSKVINHAENQAVNFPIQSTASDITLSGAIAFRNKFGSRYKIIGLIHDAILLDVPQQEAEFVRKELKEIMENTIKLKAPLLVDIDVMSRWGDSLET